MDFLSGHRNFWNERNRRSFYIGILLLFLALYIQVSASRYSEKSATRFVGDIFLDNLPTVNLTFLIVDGALLLIFFSSILLLFKPRRLLFGIKAFSLFTITRAFFITLTHLGIYPNNIVFNGGFLDKLYTSFTLQGGYFFSGHTGLPILMSLIFWDEKPWRWFFISVSVVMGAALLLAHVHYSIDVFAAPFMSYGILKIAEKLFPEDYRLMAGGVNLSRNGDSAGA